MNLDQIIPAIFLIAVLLLIAPEFLRLNSGSKKFIKNLSIWSIIIASIVIGLFEGTIEKVVMLTVLWSYFALLVEAFAMKMNGLVWSSNKKKTLIKV